MNSLLKDYEKMVFIITMGRSGSNMLVNTINSIPCVKLKYEPPLGNWQDERCRVDTSFFESFLVKDHQFFSHNKISGCKFFRSHIEYYGIDRDYLENIHSNSKFIFLYRENILDQFISDNLAMINKLWAAEKPEQSGYKISSFELDVKKFKGHEGFVKDSWDMFTKIIPRDHITIRYEDFVDNIQKTFDDKIFDYLEVEPCKIHNPTFKQNTLSREQSISNFNQVKDFISEYL